MLDRVAAATRGLYEIRGELGTGGMAAVYLAHDLRLNRRVAIKVMLPGLAMTEGMVERFEEEARTAAKLDHPHIVTIYSVEEVGDLNFFVMKFIDGASLEEIFKTSGPIHFDVARVLLAHVASALHYAHGEGVVHRDVKPANVMVDSRGTLIVTDFGISKTLDSPNRTQTGAIIGTPAYVSPEQWNGKPANSASDQYAFGVLAYQVLTGTPPFAGGQLELRHRHLNEAPPAIHEVVPDCPPQLAATVMRMLEKSPASRWPSLHAASVALMKGLPADIEPMRAKLAAMAADAKARSKRGFEITPLSPAPRAPRTPGARPVIAPSPRPPRYTPPSDQTVPAPPRDARPVADVLTPPPVVIPVASIALSPAPATVRVGERFTLTATALDEQHNPLADRAIAWSSSRRTVATVGESGEVTAHRAGAATIVARCEGASAEMDFEVLELPVASIELSDAPDSVFVGRKFRLKATTRDSRGEVLRRDVIWSSSNPSRAEVSERGIVEVLEAGDVVITAHADDVSATLTFAAVPAPPAPPPFSVRLRAAYAEHVLPVAGRLRTTIGKLPRWWWAVPTALVLAIVLAILIPPSVPDVPPGQEKDPLVMPSLRIANPPQSIVVGDTFSLSATMFRSGVPEEPTRGVSWRTLDPDLASVDSRGRVEAIAPGTATLVAATPEASDSTTLVIVGEEVATLVITSPPIDQLAPRQRVRMVAQARSARGRPLADVPIVYRSSEPGVATVDSATGWVTGVAEGTAVISAHTQGLNDETSVTVRGGRLARIVVRQPPSSLAVGATLRLSAAAFDERGAALQPPRLSWSSDRQDVASVDATTGLVRARAPGGAIVRASAGGVFGAVRITVLAQADPYVQPKDPPPPPVEPPRDDPPRNPAVAEAAVRREIQEYATAVRDRDVDRVSGLYHPATNDDRANQRALLNLMREGSWRLRVSDVQNYRVVRFDADAAVAEFMLKLDWRTAFGGNRDATPTFRAELRRSGDAWRVVTCRILGRPDLD